MHTIGESLANLRFPCAGLFFQPARRRVSRQPKAMARSKSSARWLQEHFSDPYVKRAQAEGWRSRAVFKLEELIDRDRLLRPGMTIVDLGAAPGGWSQVARERLGDKGRLIALDILPMQGIGGVEFLLGDFREDNVLAELTRILAGAPVDLVLSDMAPNFSGVDAVDLPRSMSLAPVHTVYRVRGSVLPPALPR